MTELMELATDLCRVEKDIVAAIRVSERPEQVELLGLQIVVKRAIMRLAEMGVEPLEMTA